MIEIEFYGELALENDGFLVFGRGDWTRGFIMKHR